MQKQGIIINIKVEMTRKFGFIQNLSNDDSSNGKSYGPKKHF